MTHRLVNIAAVGLALALFAGAYALAAASENRGGTVALATESGEFLLPMALAEAVDAAAREHGDDPDALGRAVAEILRECAECAEDADLSRAVAAFAIFHVRGRSAFVAAVTQALAAARPEASAEPLLAALPQLRPAGARASASADGEGSEQALATLENPSQISPVE